jgi:hypothetical protein
LKTSEHTHHKGRVIILHSGILIEDSNNNILTLWKFSKRKSWIETSVTFNKNKTETTDASMNEVQTEMAVLQDFVQAYLHSHRRLDLQTIKEVCPGQQNCNQNRGRTILTPDLTDTSSKVWYNHFQFEHPSDICLIFSYFSLVTFCYPEESFTI